MLRDMAVHLSPAVWRDLASAAIRWEGAAVVRELVTDPAAEESRKGEGLYRYKA